MTINAYVEKWCHAEYDPTQEDFYVANARYVVNRGWLKGTFIHIGISIVASLIFFAITNSAFAIGYTVGAVTLAYLLYGLNNFWFDEIFRAVVAYVFALVFLIWTWFRIPFTLQIILSVIGILLFVSTSFYILKRTFKEKAAYQKLSDEQKDYFNKKDADDFNGWKNEFYTHFDWNESAADAGTDAGTDTGTDDHAGERSDSGHNDYRSAQDPLVQKAISLFEGSLSSFKELRTRYRQLALKYHPSVGGDEELFKRIVAFYEDHKNMFDKAE